MKKTLNPHDKLFKLSLKEKNIAIDFLHTHLNQGIFARLDLSKIEPQDKSFINQKYQEFHSDLLYKIAFKDRGEDAYVYFLFEHQSSPDKLMAFRFLQYQILALEDYLKQNSKAEKLPVIIPFCVYHGQVRPYPYSTKLADCFNDPKLAEQSFIEPFNLIDLTALSVEELATHGRAGIFETLLKTNKQWPELIKYLRQLPQTEAYSWLNSADCKYFTTILEYIMHANRLSDQQEDELMDTLKTSFSEHSGETMTFVESWLQRGKQEGILEGKLQGKQEGILEGMQKGMQQGIALTIRVSKMLMQGLSEQQIMQHCEISAQQLEIIKASLAELV